MQWVPSSSSLPGLLGVVLAGCVSAAPLPQVQELSAEVFGCPVQDVEVHAIRDSATIVADGCGHRAAYTCRRTQIGTIKCEPRQAQAGEVTTIAIEPRIREKASALLQCSAGEVAVEMNEDPRRFRAIGCGKRVGYECSSQVDCCALTTPGVEAADAPDTSCWSGTCETADAHQRGSLLKQGIADRMHDEVAPKVRDCYERLVQASPHATGTMSVKFIIGPDGVVTTAAVASASLSDHATQHCVLDAVKGTRFPQPEGGGIVVVTYPFVLAKDPPWQACQ